MTINLKIDHYNFETLFSETVFLKDGVFNIPRYQRAYSWSTSMSNYQNKREVDDFWEDIITRYETQETDYFGSILLNKNENGRITKYELVDGQQRLITALLLYKALGAEVKKNPLPISLESERENKIIQNILLNRDLEPDEIRTNIGRAYKFFCEKVNSENKPKLLEYFKKIQISIAVIDDEYESNLLFGRLNTRGLPLSDIDLVKYEIFRCYDKCSGIAGDDDPLKIWKTIQSSLYDNIDKKLTIDKFIIYWWRINNNTSDFSFERFKELYAIEHYIDQFLTPVYDSVEKIERYIVNGSGSDNGIAENIKRLLEFKVLHRNSGADTALFKVLLSDLDNRIKKSIIDIITLTEAFRYALEINQVGIDFENLQNYYEKQILIDGENAILDNLCESIKKDIKLNSVRFEMIRSIASLRYSTNSTRYTYGNKASEKLLLRYTLFRIAQKKQTDEVSVEHIIDKSEGGDDESSQYFKLGNTVLLEKELNNSLANATNATELKIKIPKYKESEIKQIKDFLYRKKRQSTGWKVDEDDCWNPEKFSERHIESRGMHLGTLLFDELQKYIIDYQERNPNM